MNERIISQKLQKVKRKIEEHDGIVTEFSLSNITIFGGMRLFSKFIRKLHLNRRFDETVSLKRKKRRYTVGDYLVSLIYGITLGFNRISDNILLQRDKTFQRVTGFDQFPSQSAFSRFLAGVKSCHAKEIGEVNRSALRDVRGKSNDKKETTLDLDSHQKTVYGNQQRASKGNNPKKPGRKSYHPLFCFIGETRDFLHGRFRAGNAYTSAGIISFFRECLQFLPYHATTLFVRADSGFYNAKFFRLMEAIETRYVRYAVAVKLYHPIQQRLPYLDYEEIGGGREIAEFRYKNSDKDDNKERRMVVVREKIRDGRKKRQLSLFPDDRYSYQVIVTNIEEWSPLEVWRFYNKRANVENMIKEGVLDLGLDTSPSHGYGGNAAYFFLCMLVYNLMNWYKEFVFALKKVKHMVKWIRYRFFYMAGKFVKSGRRKIFKLPRDHPWRDDYQKAEIRLAMWQPGY